MKKQARGYSLLELQIAFVVLGIGLIGMGPLVITQVKQLRQLDSQLSENSTYYFSPSTDAWAKKLGAGAMIASTEPLPGSPPTQKAAINALTVLSLDVQTSGEMKATVSLTPLQ